MTLSGNTCESPQQPSFEYEIRVSPLLGVRDTVSLSPLCIGVNTLHCVRTKRRRRLFKSPLRSHLEMLMGAGPVCNEFQVGGRIIAQYNHHKAPREKPH